MTIVDNQSICVTKWIIILLTKGTQNLTNDKKKYMKQRAKRQSFRKEMTPIHVSLTNKGVDSNWTWAGETGC